MGSTTVWTLHFYSLFYLPRGTIKSGIHEQVLEALGPPDHCLRLKIFEISNSHTELPQWLSSKESARNTGVKGLIPGSGRSPGGEHGNPLQWVTVHGVTKSQKQWKQLSMSNLHVSLELSHERCKHVLLGKDFLDENVMNALGTARSLDRIRFLWEARVGSIDSLDSSRTWI